MARFLRLTPFVRLGKVSQTNFSFQIIRLILSLCFASNNFVSL